ncbi:MULTISPECIES: Na+/H+ antiporter NhaA [Bacteroidota]|uniref:Na(+)/H(+) antiporter NhaA n=9 Tax=Bacteroidota TaxID=976 RepID=A0A081PK58_9SPHI|nr:MULTISPECIES: Na+/H+ antiporter NhaA [Bacteroidota]MBP7613080.1 Na+/H+ antiporter NhaA [Paludibacter sp.]ASE60658.1 Na+/H+ antiporter NhaA [Chryseobacterium indologenes]EFK33942.1 Na+/H+ antiporter NhaA [Chryseobacterium gleum ATCC 35910]KEQ31081.1 pH-dependent sodium/proton antiporter [Pedobacter antarcticus 4BY]MBB1647372.1 Na+/H+ antiporter NhaA [Sphingobacterium sp. UME9]
MKDKINLNIFKDFVQSSNFGGFLLFLCVVISMIVANTSMAVPLQNLLDTKLGYENEAIHLNYSVSMWINDGLMAIFFLLVGLEIKREIVEGELSSPKKAILPILAAIGGAVVPALIYLYFNSGTPTASGWGIPMATDIAFALAVISLLDKRVPTSLKIFLAALAIVDDLIAILVIAIFYSSGIELGYLGYAGIGILVLILMNRFNIKNPYLYLIPGVFIWYFVHHSGIHATIAGVLVAMTLPTNDTEVESPLEKLEHALVKPVNFLIIPIFAFANTNITIHQEMIEGLTSPLGLGISLGLIFGKPIGIVVTSLICSKLGIGQLPANSNFIHIIGLGLLAGIGFTMSIFISMLSFDNQVFIEEAKLSVLITSLIAGIIGYVILNLSSRRKSKKTEI